MRAFRNLALEQRELHVTRDEKDALRIVHVRDVADNEAQPVNLRILQHASDQEVDHREPVLLQAMQIGNGHQHAGDRRLGVAVDRSRFRAAPSSVQGRTSISRTARPTSAIRS